MSNIHEVTLPPLTYKVDFNSIIVTKSEDGDYRKNTVTFTINNAPAALLLLYLVYGSKSAFPSIPSEDNK